MLELLEFRFLCFLLLLFGLQDFAVGFWNVSFSCVCFILHFAFVVFAIAFLKMWMLLELCSFFVFYLHFSFPWILVSEFELTLLQFSFLLCLACIFAL